MARPRVVTFNVASVDGRLTLAPGIGLMAPDDRWSAMVEGLDDPYQWARTVHDPQLLLEGSGSFLAPAAAQVFAGEVVVGEGGQPPEGEHFLPDEVARVADRRWFGVVDGPGAVDLQFAEWPDPAWAGWHAVVFTSLAAPEQHLGLLRQRGIPYVRVGRQHVDLPRAPELARELLGVESVVCTGGGRLGGALLRQGLVDEVDLMVLPWVVGGRGTPALFDALPLADGEWPTRLELVAHEELPGGRLRLRYRVVGG